MPNTETLFFFTRRRDRRQMYLGKWSYGMLPMDRWHRGWIEDGLSVSCVHNIIPSTLGGNHHEPHPPINIVNVSDWSCTPILSCLLTCFTFSLFPPGNECFTPLRGVLKVWSGKIVNEAFRWVRIRRAFSCFVVFEWWWMMLLHKPDIGSVCQTGTVKCLM